MKILISIPTYNRLENIKALSDNLINVDSISVHDVYISDDASYEYDIEQLKNIFPKATINRNEYNMGADQNTFQMIKYFLTSDNDVLFICDSDLIINKGCLNFIDRNIKNTQGIMSVFNANKHEIYKPINDDFIQKKVIGAAGMVLTKELAEQIVSNIAEKQSIMIDWNICNFVNKNNIMIFVSRRSFVQHSGIDGENSNFLLLDYGLHYICSSQVEKERIFKLNETFVERYLHTSDSIKVRVLVRKIFREAWRKVFTIVFSQRLLIDLLQYIKVKRNRDRFKL